MKHRLLLNACLIITCMPFISNSMEKEKEKTGNEIHPSRILHQKIQKYQLTILEAICNRDQNYLRTALKNSRIDLGDEMLGALLNNPLDAYIDSKTDKLLTEFHNARALFNKIEKGERNLGAITSLGFAVYNSPDTPEPSDYIIIDQLIDAGGSLNLSRSQSRLTPLHIAIKYKPEYINHLIQKGALVDGDDHHPRPLFTACSPSSPVASFHCLLEAGCSVAIKGRLYGLTPLHVCCQNGSSDSSAYAKSALLINAHKALIETPDIEGATPIFYAARANSPSLIGLLLKYNANVKKKTKSNYGIIDYLDPDDPKPNTVTAQVASLLLRSGTPYPRSEKHKPLIDLALTQDLADSNKFYKECITALVHNNTQEAIKLIKKVKISKLNEEGKYGLTPLHMAVIRSNHDAVIALLVRYGENSFTINNKIIPIVSDLFANPLDINSIDEGKRTPLAWAIRLGETEIAQTLKSAGAIE